jgi:hypothetical protein
VKVEGLLLQRVHRVEDSNNQRLFESFPQGVRAGSFWKLEFASESSGGITPLKCSKGDGDRNHLIEVKFRRENTRVSLARESLRSESGGQNSPWRTREVARTVGSSGVARWLGVG